MQNPTPITPGDDRLPERFWSKVTVSEDGCWLWIGAKLNDGYGLRKREGRTWLAHRDAYEHLVGPIPDDLETDHLCRVRECCNPAHLELVTHAENLRRRSEAQTHCKHGHEFTEANTYRRKTDGARSCRECGRQKSRARKLAARLAA